MLRRLTAITLVLLLLLSLCGCMAEKPPVSEDTPTTTTAATTVTAVTTATAAPTSAPTTTIGEATVMTTTVITTAATTVPTTAAPDVSRLYDIADKRDLVAIMYSTWFDPILNVAPDGNPPDISKVLAGESDWGGLYAFHYWSEPALGYYKSTDRAVIRQHMIWLEEAGIDFIIIDNTNASLGWKDTPSAGSSYSYWEVMVEHPLEAILETILEMRAEGLKTPYVAQWCANDENWSVVNEINQVYYANERYRDCFVYWDKKPFFVVNQALNDNPAVTWRKMWGLQGTLAESEWCFLSSSPKVSYDANGRAEQVGVCTAAQQTYMSHTKTATGRKGGLTYYNHWQTAFIARPKVVTLTWWNEWAAQRFEDEAGNSLFVDNYTPEFSRDIEPMKGGHGDTYYQWTKQYITAYKRGDEDAPRLYEGAEG